MVSVSLRTFGMRVGQRVLFTARFAQGTKFAERKYFVRDPLMVTFKPPVSGVIVDFYHLELHLRLEPGTENVHSKTPGKLSKVLAAIF